MKAREVKRAKLVAKYAAKRAALKEAGDYAALDKLPKNASSSSVRWLPPVSSRASRRPAGDNL